MDEARRREVLPGGGMEWRLTVVFDQRRVHVESWAFVVSIVISFGLSIAELKETHTVRIVSSHFNEVYCFWTWEVSYDRS